MLERGIGSLLSIAEDEAEAKSPSLIPEKRCLIAGARALVLLALHRRKKMQEPDEGETPSSSGESGKLFKEVSRAFSMREESGRENAAQIRHRFRKISQFQQKSSSDSSKAFRGKFLVLALGILPFLVWFLVPGRILFFSWNAFLLPLSIGLCFWGFSRLFRGFGFGCSERAKGLGKGCRKGACDECRSKEEVEQQRAQRAKQQFMAYVFHNIRVPFNAIVLGLGHMRASAGENSNGADTLDLVQLMLDCAETMTNVLDDVTDMGNWEEGRIDLNRDVFDLLAVVKFLAWGLKDLLEQKQISLNIDIDPVASSILESHNIVGDKHRTVQTLGNFLSNAVKFTPTGGKLDLEIKCEELDPSRGEECNGISGSTCRSIKLFIAVNDTGAGISSDDQDKLFEADSFISSSWVQKAGVSGLGLSVAKRFIEQIGGHIGVRSREQGSTFFFSAPFPLVPVQKRANGGSASVNFYTSTPECDGRRGGDAAQMPSAGFCCGESVADARLLDPVRHVSLESGIPAATCRRKVLLVEDTRINRIILRKVLQNLNLHCDEAENGQVAVDLHREGRSYDLVLMDKEMPVMDGHEATRMLRMMGVKTPIVALTGNALQSDKELFFEAGVNEFQTKPLSRDKLIQLLARYGVESSGRAAAL